MRIFRDFSAKEFAKVLRARQGPEQVGQCVWELTIRMYRECSTKEGAKVLSGLGSACGSSP